MLPASQHKWTRPALTPASKLVLDIPPRRDERLSWPRLPGNAPAGSRTRDLSITSQTPYHYTTEPPKFSTRITRILTQSPNPQLKILNYEMGLRLRDKNGNHDVPVLRRWRKVEQQALKHRPQDVEYLTMSEHTNSCFITSRTAFHTMF